jgi:diaminohydroxyphosphoribosylaminopyrimidine deaminase/5-amino-6-(5-phosphoribosylamino)uracil reductase
MREAVRLARRARGRAAPNPRVGAVVVRHGECLGAGYHVRAGGPHAEIVALRRAGTRARGASLYVTLEPCVHWGRTPPCVETVIGAGLARVVVGMRDPDPRTAGNGLRRLRRAGLEVRVGIGEPACRALNPGYLSRVERGRPFTLLKLATSLDGRIATRRGDSRWITGPKARAFVHRLRDGVDAVAVGSTTVLADDPELTARRQARVVHRPLRLVVDSKLRTPPSARLLDPQEPGHAWLLTTRAAPPRAAARLEAAGARLMRVAARRGRVDLRAAWRRLGSCGVNEVLVEGGGGLAAALLRAGLVDRFYLLLAPRLIGGDGAALIGSLGVDRLAQALRLPPPRLRRLGDDLLLVMEW